MKIHTVCLAYSQEFTYNIYINTKGNTNMKLIYTHNPDTNENAVVVIAGDAWIYKTGIKQYTKRAYAIKYLMQIAEEKIPTPELDDVVKKNPGETDEDFENRVVGDLEHIGTFERIFPYDPAAALEKPTTFYKSLNTFPPSDIWYETEKEAKREADGIDTIYVGPVEVYDQEVIDAIREEMKSYAY